MRVCYHILNAVYHNACLSSHRHVACNLATTTNREINKYMLIYITNLERSKLLAFRLIPPATCLAMTRAVT